jgi:hypothetical protein
MPRFISFFVLIYVSLWKLRFTPAYLLVYNHIDDGNCRTSTAPVFPAVYNEEIASEGVKASRAIFWNQYVSLATAQQLIDVRSFSLVSACWNQHDLA